MAGLTLTLNNFAFPSGLKDDKANFRILFDIRYITAKGEFATENAVLPSMDTYFECDKRKPTNPNFVRGVDVALPVPGGQATFSTFDMNAIDAWDRLIIAMNAQSIHSVQFKIFDVNRDDFWNRLKEALGQVVQAVLTKAKSFIPGGSTIGQVASDALGTAADDLQSHLLKRLSNGDELLSRGSVALVGQAPGTHVAVAKGSGGFYRLELDLG